MGSENTNKSSESFTIFSDGNFTRNTKNHLLPFQYKGGACSTFSFRPKNDGCLLNIFPEHRKMFKRDIGVKQLVSALGGTGGDMDNILNHIPGIVIREYQQDTKFDTIVSLFKNLVDGASTGKEDASGQNSENIINAAAYKAGYAFESLKSPSFWSSLFNGQNGSFEKKLVLDYVENMYFKTIGSETTNFYVLPCASTDYLTSDGQLGFNSAGNDGFSNNKSTIVGKLLSALGSNVRFTLTPIWQVPSQDPTSNITINLSLFNDTIDHAINNFLFINTLIPQNMSFQYGVFRMPPCAYDIKIEGGKRLMMCSGKFDCKFKGVSRRPSKKFFEKLEKYQNKDTSFYDESWELPEDMVRIPDVYELNLDFKSLLPDVFNTYMLGFTAQNQLT